MDSSTFQLKVFLFLLAERFSENFAHKLLEEDKRGCYRSPGSGRELAPRKPRLAACKGAGLPS